MLGLGGFRCRWFLWGGRWGRGKGSKKGSRLDIVTVPSVSHTNDRDMSPTRFILFASVLVHRAIDAEIWRLSFGRYLIFRIGCLFPRKKAHVEEKITFPKASSSQAAWIHIRCVSRKTLLFLLSAV